MSRLPTAAALPDSVWEKVLDADQNRDWLHLQNENANELRFHMGGEPQNPTDGILLSSMTQQQFTSVEGAPVGGELWVYASTTNLYISVESK